MSADALPLSEPDASVRTPRGRRLIRLKASASMRIGIGVIIFLALCAIIARLWTPYNPNASGVGPVLAAPSAQHLFGTDQTGADVFSRTLYATTLDVGITLAVVVTSLIAGTFLGALAGFFGGWFDLVLMRVMEILDSFPSMLLAMLIVAATGPGLVNVIVVVSIVGLQGYVRLMRAEILTKKNWQFAEAAAMVGNRPLGVLFRHLVPNSMTPLIAFSSVNASWVAIIIAALGYIGVGIEPGTAEWGSMIATGQNAIIAGQWWVSFFPGMAIFVMAGGFYLIGDGLSENAKGRN